MLATHVYLRHDIDAAVRTVHSNLRSLLTKPELTSMIMTKNGVMIHTLLQSCFDVRYSDVLEQIIHEHIMTHAFSAEKMAPLAFDMCMRKIVGLTKDSLEHSLTARHPTRSDLEDIIRQVSHGSVLDMIWDAINLAGFGGKIVVERAATKQHVEKLQGYVFDVIPVINAFGKFKNVRVACVDGIIESVSEIHHLLHEAAESKEACALFVRGLSDDVKNTLAVNFDRGSLSVVPFIVPFDIHGVNVLNDICVASGTDLVSSLKGDLISSMRFCDLQCVTSIDVTRQGISILNSRTSNSVSQHVAMIIKKRDENNDDDIRNLFDQRIKSLSSGHVVIRLKDDHNYVRNAQTIDYSLRAIRAAIEHGVCVYNGNTVPSVSIVASNVFSAKYVKALRELASVVT